MAYASILSGCSDDTGGFGRIERSAIFTPPELDFGMGATGETYQLTARLSNTGVDRLLVKEVRFDPPLDAYAARKMDGSTLRGAYVTGSAPIDIVVFFAPTTAGSNDTAMIVAFEETEAKLAIHATARAISPAQPALSPASIVFPNDVEVGRDLFLPLTITNTGEREGVLRVRTVMPPFSITGANASANLGGAISPGDSRSIEAHFHPVSVATFDGSAELELEGGGSSTLSLHGASALPGVLACTPASIAFGDVPRGSVADATLHCEVTGGPYTLAAANILPAGTPFRLAQAPALGVRTTALDLAVQLASAGLPEAWNASLELAAAHGTVTSVPLAARVVAPPRQDVDLSVTLDWNTGDTDFDLHLVQGGATPYASGQDCYYEFKHLDWGAAGDEADDPFLDRDDREGFGPEEINLARAAGTYEVYVQYFGFSGGSPPASDVSITYSLRGAESQVSRTMQTCGNTWHAGTIHFDGAAPSFSTDGSELDTWRSRTFQCQ